MPPAAPTPSRLQFILRALSSRNYRLFFAGQLVSLIGTWLTSVATGWLVYRLTHRADLLGLVSFAAQVPAFLLAPLAGVLVDRWRLRRVLVVTQTCAMLQSFGLAFFALRGTITVHHVLWLNVCQGVINAFDIPARQAFVVEMVENREDLPNAIALNSSMFNSARLLGPAVAGVVIAAVGEGWCFFADGVSYCAVIVALLAMRIPPEAPTADPPKQILHDLREGLTAVFGFPPMRALMLLIALVSLTGMPYTTLMPIFATDILHGTPRTLGTLVAASGCGALCGGIYLASRRSVLGLGRILPAAAASFGVLLIAFSFSTNFYLSVALMPLLGCAMIMAMVSANTMIQTLAEDRLRGRVMSFFAMSFMGTATFGALLAGVLAKTLGAPKTVALGGAVTIVGAAAFNLARPALRKQILPIYVAKGILPPVATALQRTDAATQVAETSG